MLNHCNSRVRLPYITTFVATRLYKIKGKPKEKGRATVVRHVVESIPLRIVQADGLVAISRTIARLKRIVSF